MAQGDQRRPRDKGGHEGKNDQYHGQRLAQPEVYLALTAGLVLRSDRHLVPLANERRICYAFVRGSSNVHSCGEGYPRR